MNFLAQRRSHLLQKQDKNDIPKRSEKNLAGTVNIGRISGIGTWRVDFIEKTTYFDIQTRKLLRTPQDFKPSLHRLDQFYFDEFKEKAIQVFYECREGNSFSVVAKMKDYKQRELWGKISGEPVYNDRNQVVGIVGLFQDITSEKEQELHLKQSVAHLKNQNEGLQVFTKITSHNLRSLANNLQLSLELLRESQSKEEQEELMEGLGHISESFNTTIQHLNSMLSIQTKAKAERQNVAFREVMESVLHTEHPLILETDAEVYSDFSEMPTIPYHTDYLEFILRELLVNALKFRHPRRKPEINIYSSIENDIPMLTVKDNGLGIDLEKHGERLFQLYQTFHDDPAASGTGLFLVRTKVEAMLGTIKVSSEPDKGTIFRIEF